MADSIVIVPSTASQDWDFLGFSFNGKHSWDDFNLIRTSDGDRYNINLGPQSQDKTAENTGGDGMYFFGSNHKQKVFDIKFAFEELDDVKLREMKRWLSGKEVGDLWFDEEPYKVYSAKVTGQPNIKIIPFDSYDENGEKIGRVYKGDGSIQFTCYWPYAHTPDYIYCDSVIELNKDEGLLLDFGISGDLKIEVLTTQTSNFKISWGKNTTHVTRTVGTSKSTIIACDQTNYFKVNEDAELRLSLSTPLGYISQPTRRENGKNLNGYTDFSNKNLWSGASGLTSSTGTCTGENPGDLPAPFVLTKASVSANTTLTVGDYSITIPDACTDLTWDSKTGVVSAKIGSNNAGPINFTGTSCCTIPVGGLTSTQIAALPSGATLKYHYWYY